MFLIDIIKYLKYKNQKRLNRIETENQRINKKYNEMIEKADRKELKNFRKELYLLLDKYKSIDLSEMEEIYNDYYNL